MNVNYLGLLLLLLGGLFGGGALPMVGCGSLTLGGMTNVDADLDDPNVAR